MDQHDPITPEDLDAYVDRQLDLARQAAVERWLGRNPEAAARVMADLALSDTLRAGLRPPEPPPARAAETWRQARRLGRRLALRRVALGARRAVAACLLVAAGWGLSWLPPLGPRSADAAPPVPVFADEAAEAYKTAMRERIAERGLTYADPEEPARLAARDPARPVPVPAPPGAGWSLVGTQLVPWDGGDAVQAFWRGPDGALLVLFATEDAPAPSLAGEAGPRQAALEEGDVAYWTDGPYAYAAMGTVDPGALLRYARAAASRGR